MNRPSFPGGVLAASGLGVAASIFVSVFTPFLGAVAVARLLLPGLTLVYLLYLFTQTDERTGRVTTLLLWTLATAAAWWSVPSMAFQLLVQVGAIWLIRSLYFYSGIVPALIDLALGGIAVVTAVWAQWRTGSIFLATWCFFLVQAAFVCIPRSLSKRPPTSALAGEQAFERARRQADAALQQLFTK